MQTAPDGTPLQKVRPVLSKQNPARIGAIFTALHPNYLGLFSGHPK